MTAEGQEKIILPTDDRAARLVTVTGWVSRNGRFYGDNEDLARFDGSTHSSCKDCGKTYLRSSLICHECREKRAVETHAKREVRPWDGICMIYSEVFDKYFNEPSEVLEFLEDAKSSFDQSELRLVLCEPNYPHAPAPADYYCDELPEDGEVPDEVAEAFAVLAAALEKCAPLSWSAGKFALDLACFAEETKAA